MRSAIPLPRYGARATIAIPKCAPPKRRRSAKWKCPTSVAKADRPKLSNAARPATFEVEAFNERGEMLPTSIAGEHPLTLYLDKRELVTLMTLGHAPEALAIGFLRNQRIVDSLNDIAAVQVDWETDSVAITTTRKIDLKKKTEKKTVTTGCGQGTVYGDLMAEIRSATLGDDVALADEDLYLLIEKVRTHETIYK